MTQVIDLTNFQSPFPAMAQRNQENLLRAFENETARRQRQETLDFARQIQQEQMDEEQRRYEYGKQLQATQAQRQNALQEKQMEQQNFLAAAELANQLALPENEASQMEDVFGNRGVEGAKLAAQSSRRIATANTISAGAPHMSDDQLFSMIQSMPAGSQENAIVAANNSRLRHNVYAKALNGLVQEETAIDQRRAANEIDIDEAARLIRAIQDKRAGIVSSALDDGVQLVSDPQSGIYRIVPLFNPSQFQSLQPFGSPEPQQVQPAAPASVQTPAPVSNPFPVSQQSQEIIPIPDPINRTVVNPPLTNLAEPFNPSAVLSGNQQAGSQAQRVPEVLTEDILSGMPIDSLGFTSESSLGSGVKPVPSPVPVQPDNSFPSQFLRDDLRGGIFSGRNKEAVEANRAEIEELISSINLIDASKLSLEEQDQLLEVAGFIQSGVENINKGEYDEPSVQYLLEAANATPLRSQPTLQLKAKRTELPVNPF